MLEYQDPMGSEESFNIPEMLEYQDPMGSEESNIPEVLEYQDPMGSEEFDVWRDSGLFPLRQTDIDRL